jgi:aspartyl-tRNA(Asn)/glutamyl-tRNA(Gln) amidotransferase subunit A
MALSWSLDHLGPMTRTVADAALMLGVMAGHDAADATSSCRAVPDYTKALERGIAGLRIGLPQNYYFDGVSAEMAASVRKAANVIAGLGARVTELRVPDPQPMTDVASIIISCESTAIHARAVREHPHDLTPVSRTRLHVGFQVSAYDYLQATRLRARLTREFVREVFTQVDALVAPVIPEPAPALAEVTSGTADEVIARMARFSRLTRPFNGLGLPALALPCGVSADGLPFALQIVGRAFDEGTVLRIGHAYEQAAGWWTRRPARAS